MVKWLITWCLHLMMNLMFCFLVHWTKVTSVLEGLKFVPPISGQASRITRRSTERHCVVLRWYDCPVYFPMDSVPDYSHCCGHWPLSLPRLPFGHLLVIGLLVVPTIPVLTKGSFTKHFQSEFCLNTWCLMSQAGGLR